MNGRPDGDVKCKIGFIRKFTKLNTLNFAYRSPIDSDMRKSNHSDSRNRQTQIVSGFAE